VVARPGDPMPGGGKLVNASLVGGNIHINNLRDVVFSGLVHSDIDGDGENDTASSSGSMGSSMWIAKTGTAIPGVGSQHRSPPQHLEQSITTEDRCVSKQR